jgi:DNA-directed RNA polymerase specialized sigma24 family protein
MSDIRSRTTANRSESPLTWLRRRKDKTGAPLITDEQFKAGLKLAGDFRAGEMGARTTMAWHGLPVGQGGSGSGGGRDIEDRAATARDRVRRALSAVGPDFAGVLIDVCCLETGLEQIERRAGWPERSGKIVVQYALQALARHYGYISPTTSTWAAKAPIRHWGAHDYRPAMDGAAEEPAD